MKHFHYDSIDSTNTECFRKFAENERLPFYITADQQTNGRGQFERTWYSADRKNLYISFAFIPKELPQEFRNFSLTVAKRLAKRLRQEFNTEIVIKDPNDLYGNGKKFCGILTESRVQGDRITCAVVGIGLNVAGDLEKFPNELRETATTLSEIVEQEIALDRVRLLVIEVMEEWIKP